MKLGYLLLCLALLGSLLFFAAGVSDTATIGNRESSASDEVLYIQAVSEGLTPDGERVGKELHELWFDLTTQDTRYHVMDADGQTKSINVRQGRTAHRYNPKTQRVITQIAPNTEAQFLQVASQLLGYRDALRRGELQVIAEGEVEGRPAIRAERQWVSPPYVVSSWLDKETLLPLEQVFALPGPGDSQQVEFTLLWEYPVIERVDRDAVPADLFTLEVPAEVTKARTHYLTMAEAAAFEAFDVYYLGERYRGLPIFALAYEEAWGPGYRHVTGSDQEPLLSFVVTYAEPFVAGSPRRTDRVALVQQQPVQRYRPREVAPGVLAEGERIEVDGREAMVYTYGGGVDIELQLVDTFIRIHGLAREEVIPAVRNLQKMN